ncbi:hypothetical protein BGZ73_000636, partial [Actinomortierella ambigua]
MPSSPEASSLSNIPSPSSTATPNPESSATPSIVAVASSDQEATPSHSRSGSMSSIRSGNTTPGLHPLWTAQFDKRHRGESNASISSATSTCTASSVTGFNAGGGTSLLHNSNSGPSNGGDGTCSPQMISVRPNRASSAGGTKGGGISSLINKFNNNNESPTAAPLRSFTIPTRKGVSASPSALSSPTTTVPPLLPASNVSSPLANNPFIKAAGRPRASSSSLLDQVATMPLGKPSSSSAPLSSSSSSSAAVPPAAGEAATTEAASLALTTTASTAAAAPASASTPTHVSHARTEDGQNEEDKKNVAPESAGSALSDSTAPSAPSKDRYTNNTIETATHQRRGS